MRRGSRPRRSDCVRASTLRATYHLGHEPGDAHVDGEALARSLADLDLPDGDGRRRPGRHRARHPRRRGRLRRLGRRPHADRRGRPLAALRRLERRGRAAARARARAGGRGPLRRRVRAATRASRRTTSRPKPRWPELRAALARPADPRRARAADAPGRAGRHAQPLLRAAAGLGRERDRGARGLQQPARGAPRRIAARPSGTTRSSISCSSRSTAAS